MDHAKGFFDDITGSDGGNTAFPVPRTTGKRCSREPVPFTFLSRT